MAVDTHQDLYGIITIMDTILNNNIYIFLLILVGNINGQNLVENSGFEKIGNCPSSFSQFDNVSRWNNPTRATPDLFSECNKYKVGVPNNFVGKQDALSGKSYAGIWYYSELAENIAADDVWNEYIQGKLKTKLEKDSFYLLSINISLAEESNCIPNHIELSFSKSHLRQNRTNKMKVNEFKLLTSKDSVNVNSWVKMSCFYKANGNERFFQIGNFIYPQLSRLDSKKGSKSVYVFIDDVLIEKISEQKCKSELYSYKVILENGKTYNLNSMDVNKIENNYYISSIEIFRILKKQQPNHLTLLYNGEEQKFYHKSNVSKDYYHLVNGKIVFFTNKFN